MKKRKILIPAGIAAGIVIGAVIWQGTRPGEVTNFNKSFEAEQQAPGEESTQSAGAAAGIQIPGYKSITIPAGTKDVSVELMNPGKIKFILKSHFIFRRRMKLFTLPICCGRASISTILH